jgi:3-oxoadipate enol-lactonase
MGELAWDTSGDPDDHGLVLIHSLGADSRMWADQIPELEKQRRLVWIDLPGHGSSGAEKGDYTIEGLALDMADLAAEAGLETFDVCGISLGGVISLWMAINLQDRVDRLIACNTSAKIGTEDAWSERIDNVLEGGMGAIRDAVVPRFITTDLEQRRPAAYRKVYEMFDAIDPVGYAGCCAALRDTDLRDSVAEIGAPTLLIGGSEDISTPPETMESLHGSIPGSRLMIIDGAAHLSNIDQPDRFNGLVLDEITGTQGYRRR